MGNPFVHLDLSTVDMAAAKAFYRKVFDWKFISMPALDWTGIDVGGGVGGGISSSQDPKQPTSWTAYVGVDNVKKSIAKAGKAGATIVVPFLEVPGQGYLGVFVDPQGATIGVWQAAAPAKPPAKKAPVKKVAAKKAPVKKAAAKKVAAKKAPRRK
jgi:uncharacterized protein